MAGGILTVGLAVGGIGLRGVFGEPKIGTYLLVLSIIPLTDAWGVVPDAILRRTLQFKRLAARTSIAVFAAGAVALVAAYAGFGAWALAALPVVSSVLSSVLALALCGRKLALRWDAAAGDIMKGSARLSLSGFASASLVPVAQIAVGALAGATAAGAYSLAQRIIGLLMALSLEPARNVALPLLSRLADDLEARRRAVLEGLGLITTAMAPLYSGLFVAAPLALPWLLGDNGAQAVPALQVLCALYLPVAIFGIATQVLVAQQKPEIVFSYTIWQAIANVVISVLVAAGGALPTAWGYVVRAYVLVPLVLRQVSVHGGVAARAFLNATLPPAGAGLVMAILVDQLVSQRLLRELEPVFALSVLVVLGALAYPILLRLLAPRHFAAAQRTVESLLSKRRPLSSAELRSGR